MKTRSAKAKGRKLQDFVRDIFRDIFRDKLQKEDIESRQMGGSGTDVIFTPAAKKLIPFDIECKNTQKFNRNSTLKQAENNSQHDRIPLVIFSKNNEDVYTIISLNSLIKLLEK